MNQEGYIKDLAPELQERARACGGVEELLALAKETKVPVPDEVLVAIAIAGGDDVDAVRCFSNECPRCGRWEEPYWKEKLEGPVLTRYHFKCSECGHKWYYDS